MESHKENQPKSRRDVLKGLGSIVLTGGVGAVGGVALSEGTRFISQKVLEDFSEEKTPEIVNTLNLILSEIDGLKESITFDNSNVEFVRTADGSLHLVLTHAGEPFFFKPYHDQDLIESMAEALVDHLYDNGYVQ